MHLVLQIKKCTQCVWKRLLRTNIFALYDSYLRLTFVSFVVYNNPPPLKKTRTGRRDLNLLRSAEIEDCHTKLFMAAEICSEFHTLITFV
jgi:hypothetical protein